MGGGNPRSRPNTCRRPQIRCVCDLCYTHRCSSEVAEPTVERATFVIAWATGWRRLIECLKLQVIFCKRATTYMALLQKMTYTDKSSYESLLPCAYYTDNLPSLFH